MLLVVRLTGPLEHAADITEQAHTNTHNTPTPCSSIPGPKLNLCKILLLLRIFITAALRHVREGIEQERQGANMMEKKTGGMREGLKVKMMMMKCTQD